MNTTRDHAHTKHEDKQEIERLKTRLATLSVKLNRKFGRCIPTHLQADWQAVMAEMEAVAGDGR
jgi:hypothetical protein